MFLHPARTGPTMWSVRADRDRAHFDRWAPRYDRNLLQPLLFGPTHRSALAAAAIAGAQPKVVLDVGCGTGRLLERAADWWPSAKLVGLDASARMIEEARRKHPGDPRFQFEVAAAEANPLAEASVDLALTTISFHHWTDQARGVREIARVLTPGGVFVLADILPPPLLRPVMRRFHGPDSRRRLFEQAGLEVVDQRRPARLLGAVLLTAGRKH